MSEALRGDGVRRANLSRILRLVHVDGPRSRAALTEATGLNRSTVADLVGELVEAGLAEEHAPDARGRVGRPSPVVAPAARVAAIAVNPEVDATTIAAVGLDRRVIARDRIETPGPPTPQQTAELIAARVRAWRSGALRGSRIEGIGIAVPGLVRSLDGLVRIAPHLGWNDAPLRDLVGAATGLPTSVGNDASLGALAEHLFGAARGVDDVIYLNGGASGLGGGLIVHGMPVGGAGGYAGEFGHNRPGIADTGDRRASGGVLEDEVSRARLLDAVGLDVADEPTLAAALAAASSPRVADEVARQRRILVTALANAVNVLDPAVVVLGGFLATIASDAIPEILADVKDQAMPYLADALELRLAVLAEDRLLIGAAELAFAELLRTPTA